MAPKGARYIVSLRDPKDALVSTYRFMEGWFFEPGAISIEAFAANYIADPKGRPSYWTHLLSWWAQRDNPNVLLLSYEHMSADPAANIRRVADFCGIALDDDLMALTLRQTAFDFMLRHKDRFDDRMMRDLSEDRCNLPPDSDSAKVRKGGVGGHRQELPAEISRSLDAIWTDVVTPATGFVDYAGLEAVVRERIEGR
jgi:hypothetical protein